MATLRDIFYGILSTDAQSAVAGSLGAYLDHRDTEPYGVFYMNPPEEPDYPLITYFFNAARDANNIVREMALNVTVWTEGDAFSLILARIEELLDEKQISFIDATDFDVKKIEWNWESPDLFDSQQRVYYKQVRYLIKACKI